MSYREGTKNGELCPCCRRGVYQIFKKETITYPNGQKRVIEYYQCTGCRDVIEFVAYVQY